jgi:hypothetical protein
LSKKATAPARSARARLCIAMGRDEDDRYRAMSRGQLPLELQAAHPRHPHVDDQASRGLPLIGLQKVLRRGKHRRPEPHRSEETLDGVADRFVIVHHGDQGYLGHARLSWLPKSLPDFLGRQSQ